ncbi:hypothetical protein wcw_0185 [Waddlia chondrophila WSU 86-1044]|uniref:Uncharacterized protein n=1 Tax=Waddlia chondrophila (strain ATCC VR-1470 / WSU 86-1044) TaxID=716544 RepID=D6YTU9_WADCW|nr:hypothetical protein wcw_0185 [Waddlia chondrophila WSU 86-1044]
MNLSQSKPERQAVHLEMQAKLKSSDNKPIQS